MDTLYHQTNQLLQDVSDLFIRLEKETTNQEAIENDIQAKINAISA